MIVPIAAVPFQDFSISNGVAVLYFEINWLTRFEYFLANIYQSDRTPITLGRALHPDVNLLNGLNIGLGEIYLDGADPTPTNLGIDNRLIWNGPAL